MIGSEETLTIAWCDNGSTDAKFTESMIFSLLSSKNNGINITQFLRMNGNQIARQREELLWQWRNVMPTDWILWIDSDIVLNIDALKVLIDSVDKEKRPVVSGLYFILKEIEQTLPKPSPCIFLDVEANPYAVIPVEPIPENELIKIDAAGFGFVLMHKSILEKLDTKYKDKTVFEEHAGIGENFISEDIGFFRKLKEVGVPVYAHTGAHVQHIKRFAVDINYYLMYMDNIDKINK